MTTEIWQPHIYEAVDDMHDTRRHWMNAKERSIIKNLEKFLIDNGKGVKHGKFAELLHEFDITFVNHEVNPQFTAAVSFETHMIYISTGFITEDPSKHDWMFGQLSVLIRHEMAHVMMQHQARMIAEWNKRHGKDVQKRLSCSYSLHDLNNIIEDLEISNRRYSKEDKEIVRHMTLNGQLIGGLVTDRLRSGWSDYTLEQMYDALVKEIAAEQKKLNRLIDANPDFDMDKFIEQEDDMTRMVFHAGSGRDTIGAYDYVRAYKSVTEIEDAEDLYKMAKDGKIRDDWSNVITTIYPDYTDSACTEAFINKQISTIAHSAPTEFCELDGVKGGVLIKLYTPEEKFVAIELCKSIKDDLTAYDRWFEEVKKTLGGGKYSEDDLKKIFDALSK